uniref:Olfactory receptor n=1 Tax=Pelodiscus sinensis TaxID=13735 RepID=K7EWQ5_PELSI
AMGPGNHTRVTDFILQGLLEHSHHQGLFFALFLGLYTTVLLSNSLIIVAIVLHPPLHTPMYYFITNLALVDILCTSSVLPKMLEHLMQEKKTISFGGCITQLFVFTASLGTELLLLTVMSYDRYVAICHPLHYVKLMRKEICLCLAAVAWAIGTGSSFINILLVLRLDFCRSRLIQHFFCEFPTVLALSCSSTYLNEVMMFLAHIYSFIIITILKIQSTKGKQRAFSTCSSHLLVVTLYYSTLIYIYIRPTSSHSRAKDKIVAVLYTLVTPILNPLIYSLRNNEVKVAFRKILPFIRK